MRKDFLARIGTIIAAGFMTLVISPLSVFAAGNVTLDQAKKIALEDAGCKANEVTIVKEGIEINDGKTQYEIEFYKGDTEYDYEIDAATGAIISFDKEIETKYMTTTPKVAATVKKQEKNN